jgi:hypothetical protein
MLFAVLAAAAALVGVDRPIVSGADYAQACQGLDARQQAACMSYLAAVIATADAFHADSLRQMGRPVGETTSFMCPTEGFEGVQLHSLTAIAAQPELAASPAALGILSGLLDAYPCTEEPSEPDPLEGLGRLPGLAD